uniref:Uncharacterized protein n=1 Tax=Magallana gigas TaxID=29159 RepID=K1RDM9_MAGGI
MEPLGTPYTVTQTITISWSLIREEGIVLSVFSGILYGQMFTPAIYLQDHGHSKNALDYVFACFCGIYSTSTVYFVIYIIFMKNKPKVYPKVILPGVISGLMWGGATAGCGYSELRVSAFQATIIPWKQWT